MSALGRDLQEKGRNEKNWPGRHLVLADPIPTLNPHSPPQSPVPPKLDPKGQLDIERHMFSLWKTLETQSPP